MKAVVFKVENHPDLLSIEELPDFEHSFQVVPRNLVKVALLGAQLLLVLLFQNLEVKL